MIIDSIDRQYSTETELACRTAPPLDQDVFHEFRRLVSTTGQLGMIKFREVEGRLCMTSSSWTPKLRDTIDSLLTTAENSASHAQKARAERIRLELNKKERALDAAAKALGLPLK